MEDSKEWNGCSFIMIKHSGDFMGQILGKNIRCEFEMGGE